MKRIILLFTLSCWTAMAAWCQNRQTTVDSAELIVDRYIKILNFDAIKSDSMLYIESRITHRSSPNDTIILKRWYLAPYSYRTELWHKDTLTFGLLTNGRTTHKRLKEGEKKWEDVSISSYMDDFPGYDFHGPFAHYKVMGWAMEYQGVWDMNGHKVYRIFVQAPRRYDRYYLFEKETNLLFLIDEKDTYDPSNTLVEGSHVDWRAYHEYTPKGACTFPTIESYQYEGEITTMHSQVTYLPIDESLFLK